MHMGASLAEKKMPQTKTPTLTLCDEALRRPWYVALTLPRQEAIAAGGLTGRQFKCWYPQESRSVKVNAIRRQQRRFALIPGYVFCSFDVHEDDWQRINDVAGVRRLMMVDERPVPIASEAIKHLRDKEIELAHDRPQRRPKIAAKIGSWVQLIEHPSFAGLFGKVTRTSRRTQRVTVEIDLFGRAVPVMIDVENIRTV